MAWTESQKTAINDRGRSLLISAGAGSGKTTVLAERLTEMLVEGGSIDDFLVVTFTKAAAGDLKEKLYQKLSEVSALHPEDKRLLTQLLRLSGAQISTIHSFCFELIRRNFNSLSLSAACRIADESESESLLNEAIEELKEKRFTDGDADITLLADNFCPSHSEDELDALLKDIYGRIRAYYRYDKWLLEGIKNCDGERRMLRGGFFATQCGGIIRDELQKMLRQQLEAAERLCHTVAMHGSEKNMQGCGSLYDYIGSLLEKCGSYAEFPKSIDKSCIKNASCKDLDEDIAEHYKKTKKRITDRVEKLISQVNFGTEEDIDALFAKSRDVLSAFNSVIMDMDGRYAAKKASLGLLDYADLEHFAMRLLENDDGSESDLCMQLKKKYVQVFIDEYQDVNPLQDRIFSFISRDDNRFIVGDVKQSIYRFRNAYPDIFLGYKKAYGSAESGGKNASLFLRENFRCDRTVIDFVNAVIGYASNGGHSAAEYEGESLIYAKDPSRSENTLPTVAYATYGEGEKESAQEKAVDFTVNEIRHLVDDCGYKYSDVALLFSAVKGYTVPYENAFRRCGIPYIVVGNEDCLKTPEVTLALCCLKAIDNPTDDISLFSMMRSPMYGFDADELYRIRRANDAYAFCTCLKLFAHGSHLKKTGLKKGVYRVKITPMEPKRLESKAKRFLNTLSRLRDEAVGSRTDKFLWNFYMDSGLMYAAAADTDGEIKKQNLLALYERAASFEKRGFRGVSAFCEHIRRMDEEGGRIEISGEAGGDGVLIMSIHKSKGLEFPVCFVENADHAFNTQEMSRPLLLDREMGLTFTLQDAERYVKCDTPMRIATSRKVYRASVAEELRKLYVALTRAKNRLYVVGCLKNDYFDFETVPDDAVCFMDWVVGACLDNGTVANMLEILPSEHPQKRTEEVKEASSRVPKWLSGVIEYKYPYEGVSALPAKISVSQLHKGLLEEEEYVGKAVRVSFKKPLFALESDVRTNEIGTANHLFMQFCDMENARISGAAAEGKRLLDRRFITETQYGMLDLAALDVFFASELYSEMREASELYREMRFSISDSASLLGGAKREKLLVQGVIDCFFVSADGSITVVDYKTDRVSGRDAEEILLSRHSTQLGYYCRAVEKMMGKRVKRGLIYSFALGRAVQLR